MEEIIEFYKVSRDLDTRDKVDVQDIEELKNEQLIAQLDTFWRSIGTCPVTGAYSLQTEFRLDDRFYSVQIRYIDGKCKNHRTLTVVIHIDVFPKILDKVRGVNGNRFAINIKS